MDTLAEIVLEQVQKQAWHLRRLVLTPATHLENDLAFDSLDRLQLSVRLEVRLGITIPDGDLEHWQRVADVLASAQRLVAANPAAALLGRLN